MFCIVTFFLHFFIFKVCYIKSRISEKYMSLCMRKPTLLVFDHVQHKLGCTVTEAG